MNKDIISEIYKYLNRDVYKVWGTYNMVQVANEDYFYSYENALGYAIKIINKHMEKFDNPCEILFLENIEITRGDYDKIMDIKISLLKTTKYPLIEAYKKVLNKTLEELIEMGVEKGDCVKGIWTWNKWSQIRLQQLSINP